MHPLRRRLENSNVLTGLLGRGVAGYLRLCNTTIRWQKDGFDTFADTTAKGPVLLVMWHSRILLGSVHTAPLAPTSTLHDPSPAGRLAAAMQTRFGLSPIAMSTKASNQVASRAVLKGLKAGISIGLAADGPLGPARSMKPIPIDWARVSGAPVFLYAYACTRSYRLSTWDNMLVPRPFGRGYAAYARWQADVPRRGTPEELEALRLDLEAALTAHQARVDTSLGLPASP